MSKKQEIVLQYMYLYAKKRCKIANANNGRFYMGCLILDENYCLLQDWL